ncbi:MAG: PAS domain-containing protein [Pseudomonadota bacterium]|nr:PAS domain-containing protein [Pseudomonadota bacterium]MDQ3159951.1 PAS domain-containing protein [Pseudomonadota bacterium]
MADIFRQAPAFMCVLRGPDHVFEMANERYFQLVGHRDVIGKPLRDALPEVEGQGYFELIDQVYQTGESFSRIGVPVFLAGMPGQALVERYVDFVTQPLRDSDRIVTGIVIVGVDVTDRQQAADELRQSEQFNRSLMDGTADCVKVLDMDGRLLHMNTPGLCAMEVDDFGTLCGQEWEAIWPAEARADIERSVARAVHGDVSSFEAYCPTTKGTPKWWEVTVSPVREAEGGQIVRLLAVSRDITERRQGEQALHESEARLRAATAAVSDLIWTNNADGLMEGEQRGWAEFTGQSREEYEGFGWSQALHPEDAQPTVEAWNRAVAEKQMFVFEHRVRRRDGEWRLCSVRAVPILDADNTIREWVGVHTDITERKRDEEQLRQLAAELSESSHRKDEFLATLAHELRNPLAPIRTGLQVMKLAAGNEATVEQARSMVERQVTQMVRLVDDLMDVSRISRGTLELRRERVLLATVINSAVETSLPLIEQMGQQLTVTLPGHALVVDADMTRLAQVFLNLLNNAAKYGKRGGHIHLNVERQGGDAVVTVRDSGIGIAAEQMPRIFNMFTQLDGSSEKSQGGLGIGLALVQRLVEMHGGTVEARSEGEGKGSEFVVRLPVETEASKPLDPGDVAAPTVTTSHRILVVDDNRDGADSLSEMLKMMGNDTRTAYDGQEGVDLAAEFRPDVMLLDIGLPKLNGYEACRRIREQSWGKDVVMIAVTGWGQDEDRRRSRDAGFDLHLVKPVDPQLLFKTFAGLHVRKQ